MSKLSDMNCSTREAESSLRDELGAAASFSSRLGFSDKKVSARLSCPNVTGVNCVVDQSPVPVVSSKPSEKVHC